MPSSTDAIVLRRGLRPDGAWQRARPGAYNYRDNVLDVFGVIG